MSDRVNRDRGLTLIELLVGAALTAMIIAAAASLLAVVWRGTERIGKTTAGAHTFGLVTRYFSSDMASMGTTAAGYEMVPTLPSGCINDSSGGESVIRLTWTDSSTDTSTRVNYRLGAVKGNGLRDLVRVSCSGVTSFGGATVRIVGRDLAAFSFTPIMSLAHVSGGTVRLRTRGGKEQNFTAYSAQTIEVTPPICPHHPTRDLTDSVVARNNPAQLARFASIDTSFLSFSALPGACAGARPVTLWGTGGVGQWTGTGPVWLQSLPEGSVTVWNVSTSELDAISAVANVPGSPEIGPASPLIINVSDGGQVNLAPPPWSGTNFSAVLWNFPNAEDVTLNGTVWGSVLAPKADVLVNGSVLGIVVGDSVSMSVGAVTNPAHNFVGLLPWETA